MLIYCSVKTEKCYKNKNEKSSWTLKSLQKMFYLYLGKKRNNNRSYFKTGSLKKLILSASHSDFINERWLKACKTNFENKI